MSHSELLNQQAKFRQYPQTKAEAEDFDIVAPVLEITQVGDARQLFERRLGEALGEFTRERMEFSKERTSLNAQIVQNAKEIGSLKSFIKDLSAHHEKVVRNQYRFLIGVLLAFIVIGLLARIEF